MKKPWPFTGISDDFRLYTGLICRFFFVLKAPVMPVEPVISSDDPLLFYVKARPYRPSEGALHILG